MNDIKPESIQPAEKMLLIKIQERPTETRSGLEIAGNEQNTAPTIGEVLRAGVNSIYSKGDVVIFRRYAVDEIRYIDGDEEKTVYFIADSDALGRVMAEVDSATTTPGTTSVRDSRSAIREKKLNGQNTKNKKK